MGLDAYKTTAEVAVILDVGQDRIRAILNQFPETVPVKFGREFAWTEEDIERVRRYIGWKTGNICPNCGWSPTGEKDGDADTDAE